MLDFSAYLAAQHITREATNAARFDGPARPDRIPVARRLAGGAAGQRIGLTLRRLADGIQPARLGPSAPLLASR